MTSSIPRPASRISARTVFWVLLFVSTAARVALSVFPKIAVTYGDELLYLELAQNIWKKGALTVYHLPVQFSKLLYPLLLSPFYAIADGQLRLTWISVFNALLISSSLIPAYLLGKRVLKHEGLLSLALLLFVLTPDLGFSVTFMAENLYFPLSLWGCFLLDRTLAPDQPGRKRFPRAVLLGAWCFLLYAAKEVGAAFAVASLILLIIAAVRKGRNRKAAAFSVIFFLGSLGLPLLAARLILFPGTGYAYGYQATFSNLAGLSQFFYLLVTAVILLVFLLLSCLFFPVALPLFRAGQLSPERKTLLGFSVLYAIFVALGVAFSISLPDHFASLDIRVHLRYLIPVAYPFTLLMFAVLGEEGGSRARHFGRLIAACLFFVALLFLLLRPVRFGSLVDAPAIHQAVLWNELFPNGDLWMKIAIAVVVLAGLLLLCLRRQKAFLGLMTCALAVCGCVNSYAFLSQARREETPPAAPAAEEVALLDQIMDTLDGNILVIKADQFLPGERMLDSVTDDDYYVILSDQLKAFAQDAETPGAILLESSNFQTPLYRYAKEGEQFREETQVISRADYIVTQDDSLLFSPVFNTDITPEGVSSFRIYHAADPSVIHMKDPSAYTLGNEITFFGDKPSCLNYRMKGFSRPEADFTWNDGFQATMILAPELTDVRDLRATLTWIMTIGVQRCTISVNGEPLWNGILEGGDTLSFIVPAAMLREGEQQLIFTFDLPDAIQPGNGDPRLLSVAIRSLVLEEAR